MPNKDHDRPSGQHSSVLDQDVGCPQCGYNLRGLGSGLVVCPECGQQNDVAKLLVRRWDKPWYRAPKFNLICLPVAVVLLSLLGWPISWLLLEEWTTGPPGIAFGLIWLMIGASLWLCAMSLVWQKMDGLTSIGFALLAHIPIAGYLASLVVFVSGVILTISWISDRPYNHGGEPSELIFGMLMLLGGVGLFVLSRWIERLVAGHCIRLHLRRPTTSG